MLVVYRFDESDDAYVVATIQDCKVSQRELDRLYGDGDVQMVPVPSGGLALCNGSLPASPGRIDPRILAAAGDLTKAVEGVG